MKKVRALIDTNVVVKAAIDISKGSMSPERKVMESVIKNEIKPVITITLLEEYCRIAKELVDKDFAGWLRNLIVTGMKPVFISDEICEELKPKFEGKLPKEDLIHFLTCIAANANYLITNNREFLMKAKNPIFKCLTPREFLDERM
ncbi:MAG: PIN domain-containing protein [Methanocellales archaeon]|nr:PIN domain-containing protein [Methanocellales archaeon]